MNYYAFFKQSARGHEERSCRSVLQQNSDESLVTSVLKLPH